jgi:hypothetical protein
VTTLQFSGYNLRLHASDSGTLAQLVEQRTFNPFVVGSTPAGPTKNIEKPAILNVAGFFLWCYVATM